MNNIITFQVGTDEHVVVALFVHERATQLERPHKHRGHPWYDRKRDKQERVVLIGQGSFYGVILIR